MLYFIAPSGEVPLGFPSGEGGANDVVRKERRRRRGRKDDVTDAKIRGADIRFLGNCFWPKPQLPRLITKKLNTLQIERDFPPVDILQVRRELQRVIETSTCKGSNGVQTRDVVPLNVWDWMCGMQAAYLEETIGKITKEHGREGGNVE